MLLAIMSDIHSNYLALKEVLKDAKKNKVEKCVCLGDIIGYGVQPNECVDAIRKTDSEFIYGNHEVSTFCESFLERCNSVARKSLNWTKQTLTSKNMKFLRQYHHHNFFGDTWDDGAFVKKHNKTRFVHASLPIPQAFKYLLMEPIGIDINNVYHPNECFKSLDDDINQLFIGHTHISDLFACGKDEEFKIDSLNYALPDKAPLNNNYKYIINVGSVGQPRDNDPRASYVLFDTTKRAVEFRRVEYDCEEACNLIQKSELPDYLGKRLLVGR